MERQHTIFSVTCLCFQGTYLYALYYLLVFFSNGLISTWKPFLSPFPFSNPQSNVTTCLVYPNTFGLQLSSCCIPVRSLSILHYSYTSYMNRALKCPDSYKFSICVYLRKEKEREICVFITFPKL